MRVYNIASPVSMQMVLSSLLAKTEAPEQRVNVVLQPKGGEQVWPTALRFLSVEREDGSGTCFNVEGYYAESNWRFQGFIRTDAKDGKHGFINVFMES